MNALLTLPLEDLTRLRLCLFEEARSYSLIEPTDVLVNRKGSALRPKSHAVVSDILTLAASIQDRKAVPRSLLRNGKRSMRDLLMWRSSDKCLKQAAAATQEAVAYSQQFTTAAATQESVAYSQQQSTTTDKSPLVNSIQRPLFPTAQSIASSVIVKDVYSLKMKVDELQL